MYRCKEVVFLVVQHVIAQATPSDKFGDARFTILSIASPFFSFDGLAFLLRILKLVADGHCFPARMSFGR